MLCHGTSASVLRGAFELNDLARGRVDLLARCIAASLFFSHGVRKEVRVWLMLRGDGGGDGGGGGIGGRGASGDVGERADGGGAAARTLCIDGSRVRGLRPDERCIGAAIRRVLAAAAAQNEVAAQTQADAGTDADADAEVETQVEAEAEAPVEVEPGWSVVIGEDLSSRLRALLGPRPSAHR